jgi:1-deoxy-D-xylulose-5-phosphate reductoisomerase
MVRSVKRLAVLGSTGSIGRQTLEIIAAFPDRFQVIGLAAGENAALLAEQTARFKPRFVCCHRKLLPGNYRALSLEEMATHPEVDIVIIATPGRSGLSPTLAAVKAGKRIALANKESLVMAGEIITAAARKSGARIIPVDSEHSAIWQCLEGERSAPRRFILTASGGPFRGYSRARLARVTPQQALAHPSWRMGRKVTIDSATLMNKGLEVIEAHWLFGMAYDNISVLIHPQSIVHSLVEFADGAVKAQLSHPDMRLPIQYALAYPERLANAALPHLDWDEIKRLDFEPPDAAAFPCLELAVQAGRKGGTYPAVLSGAGEAAVELFLAGRIGFVDIAAVVAGALEEHESSSQPTIEKITAAEAWARQRVLQMAPGSSRC